MRRTLTLALAGALVLGACGGGDDTAEPTTTTAPTTTERATTTTEGFDREWVAGLVTPPDGVSQDQADEFAADLAIALDDAGWPTMERAASVDVLQRSIDIGSMTCSLVPLGEELEPGAGATLAQTAGADRASLVESFVSTGVDQAQAEQLVDGWLAGMYEATGAWLCPEHAVALDEAAGAF